MDKMTRAQVAETLLRDPVLLEAFNLVKQRQIEVFEYAKSSQEDIMEAHRMVRALVLLEDQLKTFVMDGKLLEKRNK
jgi:hypothetical protein